MADPTSSYVLTTEMGIETAVYGEVNGGHGLRDCSGDKEFARRVAARMDIPSNPPPGVQWSPYPSGFAFEDRYVLARTFLDPSAPRGNMVVTQAVIMPLESMVQIANLAVLFDTMAKTPHELAVPPVSFTFKDQADTIAPGDLVAAANALVTRGDGPAVRIGLDDFEALASAIWSNLWPEARAAFSFRLSFAPQDLVEIRPPSLVATPASLAARWTGPRVISKSSDLPINAASAVIAGLRPSDPIVEFARSIGADAGDLGKLARIEQAQTLLTAGQPFTPLIAGLRLVDHLSPSAALGEDTKAKILARAAHAVPGASAAQILALRNLSLTGFDNPIEFWSTVEEWAFAHPYPPEEAPTLPDILEATLQTSAAIPAWRAAISKGARRALSRPKSRLPMSLWSWLDVRPSLIPAIFDLLPDDDATARIMTGAMPKRLIGLTTDLRERALNRGWLDVHGAILAASEPPIEAARLQISVDPDVQSQSGLEAALRHATDQNLLDAADALGDERLIARAGRAVVQRPKIFREAAIKTLNKQRIWAAALREDLEAWKAPGNPVSIRDALLSDLLEGQIVHRPLLDLLAKTPLADLTEYPRRAEIWPMVGFGASYLAASAKSWLERAQNGAISHPDHHLEREILESGKLMQLLNATERRPALGVQIAAALPSLSETTFTEWVQSTLSAWPTLNPGEAELLGGLVSERHWQRTLALLLDRYRHGRSDLKPALRSAANLLSLWDKWTEGLFTPTLEEKWDSFASVAADLYPHGPGQRELWERAGGKTADLPKDGTGGSLWRSALFLVRKGGRPASAALLHEMRHDFTANAELRFLAQDHDITSMR